MKRAAALRAVAEVGDGMVVGLGSGSTAAFALEDLAEEDDSRAVASGGRDLGEWGLAGHDDGGGDAC